MTNTPRKPGNEPDPDTTDPMRDVTNRDTDAEQIEDDGEPIGANFA